ncbi:putative bifunctional diguanylate cyclase/phosphodiesterase [Pseudomarimonas arenosa]|uniref:Bifunctional diguanylate cyclase/phosphodiesterase n=1 Tax=Pseudomarimonas arenosa TaxID=2774145 RepID=A0AAW3ZMA3_9GAMM|nr:bifunctional diguanylate cyclase/phosphodiesterase [Pseudomarimonas arenosa]MBD8525802.1 bifunctional diguanylate cyclase/phosphodiesterase [Pseudomarimonas arenosa]
MAELGLQDELTGLAARRSFIATVRRQVTLANEHQLVLGLLVIDIDGFALINSAYGFEFGDAVLRHVAEQLRKVTRKRDYVARIGDNRFALLLTQLMNQGHAELAAQKVQRLLDLPFERGGQRLRIAVTVGAALCPGHATESEHLLRVAERYLHEARQRGLRLLFPPEQIELETLSEFWDIEIELGGASHRGELQMHYQPKLSLRDLRPVGAEALMRWQHRSRGMVPPSLFIPIAEKTGQIKPLTLWAMNTALRHASEWHHPAGSVSVAVNVPAEMVAQHDLPDLVENALSLWGKPHVQLVLEITERSLVADPKHSFKILSSIRDMGVKISIDDFGTGYSCLAYFKDMQVDELKIDRSFVANLLTDRAAADITNLIIDLAHRFQLSVVAEGIEDMPTLEALSAVQCDVAQGYLFGKAMRSERFDQWLQQVGTHWSADGTAGVE